MRHGLNSVYNNHGCRCRPCRRAHTEYRLAQRLRKLGLRWQTQPNWRMIDDARVRRMMGLAGKL